EAAERLAADADGAVLDGEDLVGIVVLAEPAQVGVEAGQVLAVEEGNKALVLVVGGASQGRQAGQEGEQKGQQAQSATVAHGTSPRVWGGRNVSCPSEGGWERGYQPSARRRSSRPPRTASSEEG